MNEYDDNTFSGYTVLQHQDFVELLHDDQHVANFSSLANAVRFIKVCQTPQP